MNRYRPWVAALLSFLQPGLGHAYLRSWGRSLLWFATWVGTVVVVADVPPPPAAVAEVGSYLAQFAVALDEASLVASIALAAVTVFATLDAYWLGARDRHRARSTAPQCPNCGKELDPSLDFCHWCTTDLEEWAPGKGQKGPRR